MSEEVFLYQLSILASVIGIGVIVGPKARLWVVIAWVVWTFFMVFTRWLFIFQFLMIFIAFQIGESLEKSLNFAVTQRILRKTLLWVVGLATVVLGIGIYSENQRQVDYVAPTSSSYIEPAPQTQVAKGRVLGEKLRSVDTNQNNPPTEPEEQKFYKCLEKRGKETRVAFQDFPCGATR